MSTVSVGDKRTLSLSLFTPSLPRIHQYVCSRQSQNGALTENFPSYEFRSPTCRTCEWRPPRASDPSATLAVSEEPLRSLRASSARAPFHAPAQTLSPRSEGRGRRRRREEDRQEDLQIAMDSPRLSDENSKVSPSPKSPMEWREITAYSRALQWMSSCTARFSLFLHPPLFHQPQKTSGVLEGHTDDGRRRCESGSKGEGGRDGGGSGQMEGCTNENSASGRERNSVEMGYIAALVVQVCQFRSESLLKIIRPVMLPIKQFAL